MLDELERILRDRFGFSAEAVNFVRRDLELAADLVAPGPIDAVSRDPTDDVVLAVAQAGQVNYIVTGDRDLLSLGQHGGAVIVDPRAFIDTLAGRVE